MPSIVSLLIWIPLFSFWGEWPTLIGFVSSSIFFLSPCSRVPISSPPGEFWIGVIVSGAGLFFYSLITPYSSFLDLLIVPLLAFSLFFLFRTTVFSFIPLFFACVICFLVGWFGLHVWAIPLALPALFFGFFGSRGDVSPVPTTASLTHSVRDAILGVVLGFFPGLGPGLAGMLWFSNRASPALLISNLVFSVGFVSLSGKVRSFPAAALGGSALPSWEWILVYVFVGFLITFGLDFFMNTFSFPPFPRAWIGLHVLALFLFGGIFTLALAGVSYCAARVLGAWKLPLSLGMLLLLPPIFWFYR